MKVAPVHVLLACTYTPIRFLPQVALETGCKLCADTWAILMSSTRLESRCTISPPPIHTPTHTRVPHLKSSPPPLPLSPLLLFLSPLLPSAPLLHSPLPSSEQSSLFVFPRRCLTRRISSSKRKMTLVSERVRERMRESK